MTKITTPDNCGNSPKALQLRDFNIAYVKQDLPTMLDQLADNIAWHWVGDKQAQGKDEVAKALEEMISHQAVEFTLQNILTHGKLGAADGKITMQDGSTFAFCDVYIFSSTAKTAKIAEITSYVIQK